MRRRYAVVECKLCGRGFYSLPSRLPAAFARHMVAEHLEEFSECFGRELDRIAPVGMPIPDGRTAVRLVNTAWSAASQAALGRYGETEE